MDPTSFKARDCRVSTVLYSNGALAVALVDTWQTASHVESAPFLDSRRVGVRYLRAAEDTCRSRNLGESF